MKLLIGIPAYNEEKMIGKVLKSLPKKINGITDIDILVVDDGSSDNTARIAESFGAIVLTHLINRGLGGALKTIFSFAKLKNYDLVITFDADGQHLASDIEKLVAVFFKKKVDVVIGTRWKTEKNKPFLRYLINQCANFLTFLFFNIWTSDSQSGFRLFNKKAINKINIETDGMEVSSEFFKEIKRNRLIFAEVPISVVYSEYSQKKGQKVSNAFNILIQLLLRLLK